MIRRLLDPGRSEPCIHPTTTYLGANQDAEFLRCELCGAVIVRQGNRVWIFPRRPSREEATS